MSKFSSKASPWRAVHLGEVCAFKSGSGFREELQGKKAGDHPFIKVSDLNTSGNEKYVLSSNNWVSVLDLKSLRAHLQPPGATVFAKVGAALKLNRRRILVQPTAIDNNMMAAIPDTKFLDQEYLYYFLLCQDLGRFSQESAVPSINQSHLESVEIHLPSLAEQRKIAEILRTWDEAIAAAEAELKALQERKRWLMNRLLSSTFESVSSGGKRTSHKLGEIGRFYSGLSGKTAADFGEGRPFISYNSVFGSSRCSAAGQPLVRVDAGERQNQVKQWDIILTGSSETPNEVATSSIYCDADEVYLNSFCIGYRYDHSRMEPLYAEHYFRGQDFRRAVWPLAQGSTRFNISREELAKVVVALPSLAEQRKIANVLHVSDNNIAQSALIIEALRVQERSMMQKLIVGEISAK